MNYDKEVTLLSSISYGTVLAFLLVHRIAFIPNAFLFYCFVLVFSEKEKCHGTRELVI